MRFTKNKNPNKRKIKKHDKDKSVDLLKEVLIDKKLGYKVPIEYYNNSKEV